MRSFVLAALLSAVAITACKEPPPPPPPPPVFTPPRSYEGVALGMSQDDVVRALGPPHYVADGLDAGAPFYAVDPANDTAPPMQGSIQDYGRWVYAGPQRTVIVLFNHLPRVHALTCSTGAIKEEGCAPLENVAMGASVEAAIAVVGGPRPEGERPDGHFVNAHNSTMYSVSDGIVVGAGIAVPGENDLAMAWDFAIMQR